MHIGVGRIENAAGGYFGGSIGNSITPGHVQRQLVVNGEVLGRYGDESVTDDHGSVSYGSVAEFTLDTAARPLVSTGSASDGPVHYTVVGGETLRSIAQTVLGDASLWYLIAQANGLSGASELVAGQSLNIPMVALSHNNSTTFQPYDPSKIVGDTSPVLPMPAGGDDGCGGFGRIIPIVIAVIVTILTEGATAETIGEAAVADGAAAEGIATAYTYSSAELAAIGSGATSGALGAAAGSLAGQLAANAMGMQNGFDWNAFGLSVLSGGISGGLSNVNFTDGAAKGFGNVVARAAIANALTQGVAVVTGLQKSFNWTAVAASGIGAGVGYGMSESLGLTSEGVPTNKYSGFDKFERALLTGVTAGTATALARGERVSVQQIATDSFGNALGGAFVDNMRSPGTQEEKAYTGGEDFAKDLAQRKGAQLGATPIWMLPNPTRTVLDSSTVMADASKYTDDLPVYDVAQGPGRVSSTRQFTDMTQVAANLETMRAIAANNANSQGTLSGNRALWGRTTDFLDWGQNNAVLSGFMSSNPDRFTSSSSSILGFYLDRSSSDLTGMDSASISAAIATQGRDRASDIAVNVERLTRESLLPRLSGLQGAYENYYPAGTPNIENAVLFPSVANNMGRLDGFTGFLSGSVLGLGQLIGSSQIDARMNTASAMYDVGMLDRQSLGDIRDSLTLRRSDMVNDVATSLLTAAGGGVVRAVGGLMLAEDAFAAKAPNLSAAERAGAKILAKVNSGRAPYSELNAAIAELNGYHFALDNGRIGVIAPGKASARGVDYATYDPETLTLFVSDAKYRGPGGLYPSSIPQSKINAWTQDVQTTVLSWPESAKKIDILNAINNGNVQGDIFKWPRSR